MFFVSNRVYVECRVMGFTFIVQDRIFLSFGVVPWITGIVNDACYCATFFIKTPLLQFCCYYYPVYHSSCPLSECMLLDRIVIHLLDLYDHRTYSLELPCA